jgi:hypothetical protein
MSTLAQTDEKFNATPPIARMGDVCYEIRRTPDGKPDWRVITIARWKSLGGRVQ